MRARTLEEFKDKTPHEIGISLHGDLENFSHKVANNLEKNYSLDISERYPEERNLEICKYLLDNWALNKTVKAFSILAKHQKENTTFGQKFEVNFTAENAQNNYKLFKYKVSGPEGKVAHEESLSLESFIELFSDSEINQHFGLTEQFGDALIANLKEQTGSDTFTTIQSGLSTSFYPKIIEQLNEDQRKRFLDDLLEKASSLDIDHLINNNGNAWSPLTSLLLFAQDNLDKPKMKELAENMLIKLTKHKEKQFKQKNIDGEYIYRGWTPKEFFAKEKLIFTNLTPEFQDFLIEMDENKKIKLDKIPFHTGEELYAKFDKNPLEALRCESGMDVMPRDIYLKNYKEIIYSGSKVLSWDKSKVSSQKIPTSPLQINLFDLNDETLKKNQR